MVYCKINRLLANCKKAHFMVFDHSLLIFGCSLNISNFVIQLVNVCKFLSIFIDEKPNRCNHIYHFCPKLTKANDSIQIPPSPYHLYCI